MSTLPNRLKVLFITAWYPSEAQPIYGIFVREHALAVQHYNDVTVLCNAEVSDLARRYELIESVECGLSTLRLNFRATKSQLRKQFWRTWGAWLSARALKRRGYRPDIVHANVGSAALPALALGWIFGVPMVLTEHATLYEAEHLGRFLGWYTRLFVNRARRVMPVTESLTERMRYHGVRAPMQVVPNALDRSVFHPKLHPPEHELCRRTGPWRLLTVGAFVERKGHRYLLDALARLRARGRDMRLDMVGEGPLRPAIEQRIADLKLGNYVTLHGNIPKAEVARKMREADVFVLASNYETQGCVFFEALASGTPVVGTHVGGVPEVVGPAHGRLVPTGDVEALTGALEDVIDNHAAYNPQALAEYAQGRYAHPVVGAQYDAIYREVLGVRGMA